MPKKILLADDSITIQKVITITFATEDYEVVIVGDGDSAIKKARELKPDLIMADVAMPGKTGYEVCEAAKKDAALRHIPVMLLAGTFEPLNKAEAGRVKADDSIIKPFESQELLDKVAALLAKGAAVKTQEAEISAVEPEPEVLAVEPEPIEAQAPPPPKPLSRPTAPPRPVAPLPKAPEPEIGGIDEMFGPSGDFLGGEEEAVKPPVTDKEFTIGEQGGGFMDLEFSEEEMKPSAPLKPTPPRVEPSKPKFEQEQTKVSAPPRVAPPPPKPEPPEPKFEPEPFGFEPPKEDIFETPAFDFSRPTEPVMEEPFRWEPVAEAKPAPEEVSPEPVEAIEVEKPEPPKIEVREAKRQPEPPAPSAEAPSFAMRDAGRPVVSKVVESAVKAAEERVKEEANERLKGVGISQDKLEDTIAKIAREVIEEIAWEVVPELAEELIAAEFSRFKEAWAKAR